MEPDGTPAIPPVSGAPKQSGVVYTPPDNPDQYIRTYAKDVAALTNTAATSPTIQKKAPDRSATEDPTLLGESTHMGVTVSERDASAVNRADGVSPKPFEQEVVALSKEDSDGIFSAAPAASPVSITPTTPIAPSPVASAPRAEEKGADRAAILARLRAKLARQSEPTSPVAAVPQPPTPVPVSVPVPPPPPPPPAPRVEAPPAAPVSAPSIPRPTTVAAPMQDPAPLHTFSSDFADRIDTRKASTFSVLAAQSDAGQSTVRPTPTRGNLVPLLAGVALVVGGLGLAVGALIFGTGTNDVPYVAGVPSLIRFDESVEVSGEGQRLVDEIVAVANGGVVDGNAVVTYVRAQQEGEEGIFSTPAPGGLLIAALGLPSPAILLRNIDRSSTVGVVSSGGETRPFFVLKANSYERTFAGMLAWEPTMARDLATFFPPNTALLLPSASTTASSTLAGTPISPATMPFFVDTVVANHDVRALRDSSGGTILVYGYHGRDILIIARNEAAFTALVNRLIPGN